ncbi:hypothetical protein GCM10009624_36330 [Gordonia sinesedis]
MWSYRAAGYVTGIDDVVGGRTSIAVDAMGRVRAAGTERRADSAAGGGPDIVGGGVRFSCTSAGVLDRAVTTAGAA